ncbi:MAG: endopeptidase La [Deltaproteobacteria bacterium]|nr:endopeptidase La [Deltaproteobacteria bacterium]
MKFFTQNDSNESMVMIPVLPLRDIVVFPYMVIPLFIGKTKSINGLIDAMAKDKKIFLAIETITTIGKKGKEQEVKKNISQTGTIGSVLQILRLPDGNIKVLVEGKIRGEIVRFINNDKFISAEVAPIKDLQIDTAEAEALRRSIIKSFENYGKINSSIPNELIKNIASLTDHSQMSDTIASHFAFKVPDKLKLLKEKSLSKRLNLLLSFIDMEIEIFKMENKIKENVKEKMDKAHKDYYLNEKIKALKKEMGKEEDTGDELKDLEEQINKKEMSEEAVKKAKHEFSKLKKMASISPEAAVIRNYIDWIISLPWYEQSEILENITEAEIILDEDHYGLKKPKERILEYLAVQLLIKKVRGPILCFVGPPGVGKTSLAKSVARATGRKFVRLSLGGVRDEAEIRGHRRTYIGAMPGKVIQSLKKAGANNPVFCLDEVDKMSMDFRGDPSSALLEVLDPEQNNTFNDHYLDIDYDLSDILFITTANVLHEIPLPLQDRMEVIKLHGYTEDEKLEIAKTFLISKQIKLNGLEGRKISFTHDAIATIISRYTKEAGVRNLEREIASICRKIAKQIVKDKKDKPFRIIKSSIKNYLGVYKFKRNQIEDKNQIGLVNGLAWTQAGGELLNVEALIMKGKGNVLTTGKLGDVMKESASAALSYVRSRSDKLNIEEDFYKNFDIHIHVPEGAIPKDGPSAGITMCTAIISAVTKRPVYNNIAMTGELTLRGRVLPIGGLKEKIIAAYTSGIKKIIIPKENEKDLKETSKTIMSEVEIISVEHMDEVLPHALISALDKNFNPQK